MNKTKSNNPSLYNNTNYSIDFISSIGQKPTFRYVTYISKLIRDVNELMIENTLLNNIPLNFGPSLELKMTKIERNFDRLAVNWELSNKNKKEILAKNGKLAKKIGVSDKGNPIFDDGELWMVFFLEEEYIYVKRTLRFKIIENKKIRVTPTASFWTFKLARNTHLKMHKLLKQGVIKKEDILLDNHGRNKNNIF